MIHNDKRYLKYIQHNKTKWVEENKETNKTSNHTKQPTKKERNKESNHSFCARITELQSAV